MLKINDTHTTSLDLYNALLGLTRWSFHAADRECVQPAVIRLGNVDKIDPIRKFNVVWDNTNIRYISKFQYTIWNFASTAWFPVGCVGRDYVKLFYCNLY